MWSRAADALQTINTSEYNYAQHIKDFCLGLNDDSRQPTGFNISIAGLVTRMVFDSKSDSSKLLNTSILLMVRKASILESFKYVSCSYNYLKSLTVCLRWDVPLEISGPVYQALQKIASLRHLHVRLDVRPGPKLIPTRSPYELPHNPPPPVCFAISVVSLRSNRLLSKKPTIFSASTWTSRFYPFYQKILSSFPDVSKSHR